VELFGILEMNRSLNHRVQERILRSNHLIRIADWIGQRQVVLSGTSTRVDQMRWVTIVASHRQSHIETNAIWRESVESAMQRCQLENLALLACRLTPSGDYLLHVAKRFAIATVEVMLPKPHALLASWQAEVTRASQSNVEENQLWISPLPNETSHRPVVVEGPLPDLTMIAVADLVHAVEVSKGGRIESLLRHRLASGHHSIGSVAVHLASPGDELKRFGLNATVARELMELGAVGWYRSSKYESSNPMVAADDRAIFRELSQHTKSPRLLASTKAYCPVFSKDLVRKPESVLSSLPISAELQPPSRAVSFMVPNWTYLTHCTRSPSGPWPDQSRSGYYDEILTKSEHSHPLDTLIRILEQQKLVGSNHLKRSGVETVSLSQVPLIELLSRRSFQRHLHRWDWEPYGICIQRQWLESRGCRPVVYGVEADLQKLPSEEVPFFQVTNTQTWYREREWRMVGDIRLAEIPASEAFVFVPTAKEGLRVSPISRFPVMIVGSCTDPKHLS